MPRGARRTVASSLAQCVRLATLENSESAWEQLLTLPYRILHVDKTLINKKPLTKQIKLNCSLSTSIFVPDTSVNSKFTSKDLCQHVENKLSEGDIRGAARILFSSDVVAPYSPETLAALESKHPAPSDDLTFPDPPDLNSNHLTVTAQQVAGAVASFRTGSAGGLDGLSPQHLKDLEIGRAHV